MCEPNDFREYEKRPTQVTVWHDGKQVYQVDTPRGRVFSYAKRYESSRWIGATLVLLFSFPLLVAVGRRIGIVQYGDRAK